MYECNNNAARRHCQRVDARSAPSLDSAGWGSKLRLSPSSWLTRPRDCLE
jgi:hypothetical protein